ncbi:MAG: hypothetical protein FH756_00310 [Firmicutes bacterium]|nr:hypothetical protein [Bacillota bacterium]
MLDKIIAFFFVLLLIMVMSIGGAMMVGMVGQWNAMQNQAQFLAVSQGKYGGYTTQTDSHLDEFVNDLNLTTANLEVEVSAPNGPKPWGTPVWAKITYDFEFKIGNFIPVITVPLHAEGRAVSTYLPGAYNMTYTFPSY